ncbi:MAG: hypothetical protein QOE70_4033 [Chthoniobacter sp.]|nr:hypothetical protein [Chthoniobacter sp.]
MISLGLTNSAASNAFGTSPTRSMAGISKGSFSNSNFFPYYDSKVNGSGGGSSGGFGFSFVDGSWYQLSLDAVFNATNGRYSLRFNVTNSDSQGTLGSTIYTTTFSDNLALSNYAAAGVHPFVAFSGPVGQMGVGIVDNFVTIPEPSSIAAMLTGAIVILTRRTRTTPNGHPK